MRRSMWVTGVGVLLSISALGICIIAGNTIFSDNLPVSRVVDTARTTTATSTLCTETVTTPVVQTTPSAQYASTAPQRPFSLTAAEEDMLNAVLKTQSGVSAMAIDLGSGYTYRYNSNQRYNAASLMKAPYAMYLLQLAADGKCDLNEQIIYTEKFLSKGTGIIKNDPFGTSYSVQTLIEYAIRYSDNTALRMLRSRYPADGFQKYAADIGIQNPGAIGLITNATITSEEAAVYMRAIYTFIQTEQVYGPMLRNYMTHTNNPMFRSAYPLVRKYGWAEKSFHEMALVEAPHPYILILLTDHEDGNAADFTLFRNFAQKAESLLGRV